ncbi:MAG: prenyltransferase/squalene oxidase repeat-containing protein, partial [Planctomycetota bacterium]
MEPSPALPPRLSPDSSAAGGGHMGSARPPRWRDQQEALAELNPAGRRASYAANNPRSADDDRDVDLEGEQDEEYLDEQQRQEMLSSWLVSLIVHLTLLLILGLISASLNDGLGNVVLTLSGDDPEEMDGLLDVADFEMEEMAEPTEMVEETAEEPVEVETVEIPEIDMQLPEFDIQPTDTSQNTSVQATSPEVVKMESGESRAAMVAKLSPGGAGMVAGRTGATRAALLKRYGGTDATESSVQLGLEWLKRNQRNAGYWSLIGPYDHGGITENKIAATAMAMLAFQGDGNTHMAGPYKEEVRKAVRWLVRQQGREGFFNSRPSSSHEHAYAQAQATIAISELYSMTGDSWLRPYVIRSIEYALAAQSRQGGWRYQPRTDSDLSVTGWYVMGLKSSEGHQGFPSTKLALYEVDKYLDSVQHYDGAGYSYRPLDPPSPTMAAEGLLVRQYLGWDRSNPAMRTGVSTIVDQYNFDIREKNFYYWYYAT